MEFAEEKERAGFHAPCVFKKMCSYARIIKGRQRHVSGNGSIFLHILIVFVSLSIYARVNGVLYLGDGQLFSELKIS